MISVHNKVFEPYLKSNEIDAEVKRVGHELMEQHADNTPYFLGVLTGSFMFISDLMKQFEAPCEIGFIKATSYEGIKSTGEVKFDLTDGLSIKGRNVVIVEDIVDTGNTLNALLQFVKEQDPASVQICTLLFKKDAYVHSYPIDYVCFEVDNKFLLGYGLDYDGIGRNIPEVYILSE